MRLKISSSFLSFLQEAHQTGIFGFGFRPSCILFNSYSPEIFLALIGFVGGSEVLSSFPDSFQLI
jgi:hypothetical protein